MYDPRIQQQKFEDTSREPDVVYHHVDGREVAAGAEGAGVMRAWLRLHDGEALRKIEDASVAVKQAKGDEEALAVVKSGTVNRMKVRLAVVKIDGYALWEDGKALTNAAYAGLPAKFIKKILAKIKEMNGDVDEEVPEGLGE